MAFGICELVERLASRKAGGRLPPLQPEEMVTLALSLQWCFSEQRQLMAGQNLEVCHAGHLTGLLFGAGAYLLYRLMPRPWPWAGARAGRGGGPQQR